MLKIAGCFLVIYASFMIGHAVGQYHGRMVRELEEILLFIRIIRGQIAYAGTELPELMADSADRLNGTVKIWVSDMASQLENTGDRSFFDRWDRSMVILRDLSALKSDMLDDVDRLGRILGDMDVEAQLSRMELVENILKDRYEREKSRDSGICRLSNSLGILGGVFVVIMLV